MIGIKKNNLIEVFSPIFMRMMYAQEIKLLKCRFDAAHNLLSNNMTN
tara:strand:+ start:1360 stop:1500 length:141 start_codon:yes stop_codon:yes gene_type:complete